MKLKYASIILSLLSSSLQVISFPCLSVHMQGPQAALPHLGGSAQSFSPFPNPLATPSKALVFLSIFLHPSLYSGLSILLPYLPLLWRGLSNLGNGLSICIPGLRIRLAHGFKNLAMLYFVFWPKSY